MGVKGENTIFNEVSRVVPGKELTALVWDLTHDCAWNQGPSAVALCSASHQAIYRRSSMWGTEKTGAGDEQLHPGSGQRQTAELAAHRAISDRSRQSPQFITLLAAHPDTQSLVTAPVPREASLKHLQHGPVSITCFDSNQATSRTSHGDDKNSP